MATRPLTLLTWVAVCAALSLSYASAKPGFNNDGSSEAVDGFRNSNNEAIELVRDILEDENIDSDPESFKEEQRNNFNARLREANKDKFKKRTCKFNLGGHCATENAVKMADEWEYLKNPMSPGRRRRRSFSSPSSSPHSTDTRGQLDSGRDQLQARLKQRP